MHVQLLELLPFVVPARQVPRGTPLIASEFERCNHCGAELIENNNLCHICGRGYNREIPRFRLHECQLGEHSICPKVGGTFETGPLVCECECHKEGL